MGPIHVPELEIIGTRLIDPIRDGPADLIPGLLPKQGQLVIAGQTNIGKAQPIDVSVLTPEGWVCMGDMNIGDRVVNPYGGTSTVIGIFPQGKKQVYRVTFADGRSTEACSDHLWEVYHPNWQQKEPSYRLMTTHELQGLSPVMRRRVYIETAKCLDFGATQSLPVDPWLLGVLLGDGHLAHLQITSADCDIANCIAEVLPSDLEIRKLRGEYLYRIVLKNGSYRKGTSGVISNPLKESLRSFGLLNCKSPTKFIPKIYLEGSPDQRRRLLAGLIDTDGYVNKLGQISFTSTSKLLAEQVVYLVRSLGGVCSTKPKLGKYKKCGKTVTCKMAYTVQIAYPNSIALSFLKRKRTWLKETRRDRHLTIKSIEPTRITEAQCLKVNDPRGLYITDDFIVTHNTLTALEICSCLITEEPLWGELKPTARAKKILYVLGEHYLEVIQRLWAVTKLPMTDQVWLLGPEQLGITKWLVSQGKVNLMAVEKLCKWANGVDLVVFDPFSAFVAGIDVENDNIQMRLVLDTMSIISQKAGASCLILAHQGKPIMNKFGQEQSRKTYAIRGASAIEDAATNIFYMDKAEGESAASQNLPMDVKILQLTKRKYKGIAPEEYRLLRDKHTLRHTLLGNRPFIEVWKIDASAKVAKMQNAFPDMPFREVIRAVAVIQGVSEQTIKRYLDERD